MGKNSYIYWNFKIYYLYLVLPISKEPMLPNQVYFLSAMIQNMLPEYMEAKTYLI